MRAYEKYKDSGVSWLQGQQIPCGWTTCKLKNTAKSKGCLFIDGDWIESKNIIPDSNIIYTTTGNVGPGYFKYQSLGHISEQTFVDLNCTEVKPGDLVISRLNEPIGRACIFPKLGAKMITAVDNVVLRPDLEKYNKRYLMYQMNSPKYTISANLVARGATMHRISRSMLGDIQLIVPPLYEQEAIANYLDKKTAEIDKIIAEREKKIELLNELKSSIISRAVTKGINPHAKMKDSGIDWIGEIPEGWEVRRLKYIGESGNGLTYSPNDTTKDSEKGILVLRSSNIQDNKLSLEDNVFVNEAPLKLMVRKGDIIICSRNGSVSLIGKSILIEKDMNATFGAFMLRFRSKYNSKYVYYLVSDTISKYKGLFATTTINQLTKNAIASMSCAFAPENEQTEIVDFIENELRKIERTLQKVHSEIALLREYKQSLISEVVTGKRKVID